MPSISSPSVIQTKDNGAVVLGVTQTFNFIGAVVTVVGNQVNVNVSSGGGFMFTDFSNAVAAANDISLGGNHINNLADPIANQQAATKAYVDAAISGWGLAGNTLGAPGVLGSLDNFNVQIIRNSLEYALLRASGIVFNQTGFEMLFTSNSFKFGTATAGGIISSSGNGSLAHGDADGAGSNILAGDSGCQAFGLAETGSSIQSVNNACVAFGRASGGSVIIANAQGSMVFGRTDTLGTIQLINGEGSLAFGKSQNSSAIANSANGSLVYGYATGGPQFDCLAEGSDVSGYATGGVSAASLNVYPNAFAGHVKGYVANNGSIIIQANALAARATGCADNGNISVTANAAIAHGYATGGFTISAIGAASFASGFTNSGNITASGDVSFVHGDESNVGGFYATAFGIGHTANSYLSFNAGRYPSSVAGSPNAWVSTDPLFVLGNGGGDLARNDAYRIDKDGKILETGAKRTPVRVITGNDALSARADQTIVLDSNTGAGFTLTLPVGEEGLTYKLFVTSATKTSFSFWTLTPSGGNTVDPASALIGPNGFDIVFTGGVWYGQL